MSLSLRKENTELEQLSQECGVNTHIYITLRDSLYAGANHHELCMVISYCRSRQIDPLLKPVHLVEMSVKQKDGSYKKQKVVMPGIGLYRIIASRTGHYAGMSEPIFGPDVTEKIGARTITYPKWCKITVNKMIGDRLFEFPAVEFWKENFATGKDNVSPNVMWEKRSYGQIAKCAEAQALRKAFPEELGQEYTKEEMEGKTLLEEIPEKKSSVFIASNTIKTELENLPKDQQVVHISTNPDMDALPAIETGHYVIDAQTSIDLIRSCKNMGELKDVYIEIIKNKSLRGNKEAMMMVIEAKDKRKLEIEHQDFINELDDTTEVTHAQPDTEC